MVNYIFLTAEASFNSDIARLLSDEYQIYPAIWIGKSELSSRADIEFPYCAVFDIDKMLEASEKIPGLSTEDFQVLDAYWGSAEFSSFRVSLLQEFNRYPRVDLLRELDREVILRNLHVLIYKAIAERKPDFLLSSETPHNPVFLAIYHLVEWLGIPTLFFQPATQLGPLLLPRSSVREKFSLELSVRDRLRHEFSDVWDYLLNTCSRAIKELEIGLSTQSERFNAHKFAEESGQRESRIGVGISKWGRAYRRARGDEREILDRLLSLYQGSLREAHGALPLGSAVSRYALFFLQYQPERSSIPEGSSDTFQGESVAKARSFLPSEITLLVKEHQAQINGYKPGFLGRSAGFYNWVDSLPNTQTISAFSDSNALIRKSECVFTMTGSVGVEAALGGIPVIHLGSPWWEGMPGTKPIEEVTSYREVLEAWNWPSESAGIWLTALLQNELTPGYGAQRGVELWKAQAPPPERFHEAFLRYFCETVRNFVQVQARKNSGQRYGKRA